MINYFINIGKIDSIHPVSLVELLSTQTGITKKSVGDIHLFKKHTVFQIDKSVAKKLEDGARQLKYKGRKIILKKDTQ